jgi:hypothetical protein
VSLESLDVRHAHFAAVGDERLVSGFRRLARVVVNQAGEGAVLTVRDGPEGDVVAAVDCGTLMDRDYGGLGLDRGLHAALSGADADVTVVYV